MDSPIPAVTYADRISDRIEMAGVSFQRSRGGHSFELQIPSFSVPTGSFVVVTGRSGCGKSTLLDMLALVLAPSHADRFILNVPGAEINVKALWVNQGEAALAAVRRKHLGYVLQTGGLFPFLSARNNIRLSLDLNGQSDAGRIDSLARSVGLPADVLASKPQHVSGGQRQRVAIVRALVHRPAIILADEPTAAVDQEMASRIVEELRRLAREEQTTVVMVTHDTSLIEVDDVTYGFTLKSSEAHTVSICARRR